MASFFPSLFASRSSNCQSDAFEKQIALKRLTTFDTFQTSTFKCEVLVALSQRIKAYIYSVMSASLIACTNMEVLLAKNSA
jgi:hypothetical protein